MNTFGPCARSGHGPSILRWRRPRWRPWRRIGQLECWVCGAPLTADEAREAEQRWGEIDEYANLLRYGWRGVRGQEINEEEVRGG